MSWLSNIESHSLQAAEREFKEECGKGVDFHTICNHPVAVHQYEFPADAQKQHNAYGARVRHLHPYFLLVI
jgi:hypothetical protein